MSERQRPWWALAARSPGLQTTIREESGPDERRFFIQGRPMLQGLSWLTWGPVGALVVIAVLTGFAIVFDIREQPVLVRALFIVAFLGLPALAWLATSLLTHRLAERYLDAERETGLQEGLIGLRPQQGELFYRLPASTEVKSLSYEQIREARVAPPLGERDGHKVCLMLEIEGGRVILLDETLGTQAQKADLAQVIETSLQAYRHKTKTPLP